MEDEDVTKPYDLAELARLGAMIDPQPEPIADMSITFGIDSRAFQELADQAEDDGGNVPDIVRRLIRNYLSMNAMVRRARGLEG